MHESALTDIIASSDLLTAAEGGDAPSLGESANASHRAQAGNSPARVGQRRYRSAVDDAEYDVSVQWSASNIRRTFFALHGNLDARYLVEFSRDCSP